MVASCTVKCCIAQNIQFLKQWFLSHTFSTYYTLGVANGLGEQASTAFFASTSTLTFCHLQAASILKKRLMLNISHSD